MSESPRPCDRVPRRAALRRRALPPLLALALALAAMAPAHTQGEFRRPDPNWRLRLSPADTLPSDGQVYAGPSDGPPQLRWDVRLSSARPAATLSLPTAGVDGGDLLVFFAVETDPGHAVRAALLADGQVVAEESLPARPSSIDRQRSLIARRPEGARLSLKVSAEFPRGTTPVEVLIHRLQCFRLAPDSQPDGWLIVGASLMNDGFRDANRFWRFVRAVHPEADPLPVHMAVPGWRIEDALRRAPEYLRRHPQVRHVLVHVGGNDVTRLRPYPNGSAQMRARLRELLELLARDGRRVHLAQLSYRAYREEPRVPPEQHGSLPYNRALYLPLIREFSPWLLEPDGESARPDLYGYYRRNADLLAPDGIHHTLAGRESWIRLWVRAVAPVVYGGSAE